MTRVPFWTAERPLKEYSAGCQTRNAARRYLDFAFVPGCQNSGRKEEELVCSTWASSFLRTPRFHPGTKILPKPTAEGAEKNVPGYRIFGHN